MSEDRRLSGFTLRGRSLIVEILGRLEVLEAAAAGPPAGKRRVAGELVEDGPLEWEAEVESDPVRAHFEAYRHRARQVEDREKKGES